MQKLKGAALGLVGAAALALPTLGMAQSTMDSMKSAMTGPESHWYVGGSVGQSSAKDACNDVGGAGVSCDDTDTAFRVFGGYMFNKNFGAELGYADLGKAEASAAGFNASIKSKAWDLMVVGSLPVADKFSLYGKIGFYFANTDFSTNIPGISGESKSNNDLTYAIGAQYDFNKNLGIRGEWQRYSSVGGGDIGKSDVDVIGVGVVYRFR
jgi:OOP family OmpA-OmpF porin